MKDASIIKEFNTIKRQLQALTDIVIAIGLITGAVQEKLGVTKSNPQGLTKDDLTPDELTELKEWENKQDEDIASGTHKLYTQEEVDAIVAKAVNEAVEEAAYEARVGREL